MTKEASCHCPYEPDVTAAPCYDEKRREMSVEAMSMEAKHAGFKVAPEARVAVWWRNRKDRGAR